MRTTFSITMVAVLSLMVADTVLAGSPCGAVPYVQKVQRPAKKNVVGITNINIQNSKPVPAVYKGGPVPEIVATDKPTDPVPPVFVSESKPEFPEPVKIYAKATESAATVAPVVEPPAPTSIRYEPTVPAKPSVSISPKPEESTEPEANPTRQLSMQSMLPTQVPSWLLPLTIGLILGGFMFRMGWKTSPPALAAAAARPIEGVTVGDLVLPGNTKVDY